MSDEASAGDKTAWHIEMQQADGTWMPAINPRTDPEELLRILDYRENQNPEDEHRVIRVDVHLLDEEDVELLRQQVAQKKDDNQEAAVHSG